MSIPTLRQIMQEKEMLVLEANTYERKEPLPFKEPPEPLNVALAMELSAEAELGQLEALVTT